MTLILIEKGLALEGWPSKMEVSWVPSIYTSQKESFSQDETWDNDNIQNRPQKDPKELISKTNCSPQGTKKIKSNWTAFKYSHLISLVILSPWLCCFIQICWFIRAIAKKTYQKGKKQTHIWKIQVLSVLPQLVCGAHLSHLQLAILHAAAGAAQMHVEVHAVDAGAGIVLDAQVNVLLKVG